MSFRSILTIAILILALIAAGSYFPWWVIFFVPLLFGLLLDTVSPRNTSRIAALAGFVAWAGWSWYLAYSNDFRLTQRIAVLFGDTEPLLLLLICGVMGAFYAALGAYLGRLIRLRFWKTTSQNNLVKK